jgi:hypothetical protein
MPHKFSANRLHKFAKKQYRVTNWAEHNESQRNRGDLTIWIADDVQTHWIAPWRGSRGGQPQYSDLAKQPFWLNFVVRLMHRQAGFLGMRLRRCAN